MSSEGTHEREESEVEQGPPRSSSPSCSDGPSGGHGTDEANSAQNLFNRAPSLGESSLHQQEAGPSAAGLARLFLPFAGEERDFRAPKLEQEPSLFERSQNDLRPRQLHQFGTMEMGRNYGGPFSVDPPAAARSTGISLGSGYHLPTSNLPSELRFESSSRFQLPRAQQPYPQNSLGAAIGAPSFPMRQWANDPNWQTQNQLSIGLALGTTQEIQFQGLVDPGSGACGYYPGGGTSTNKTKFPNTQQPGLFLGLHPNPREMGESSSRNVRMRMTLQDNNSLPSAELQLGSLLRSADQASRNPHPPRPVRNSVYDPTYEAMGLPVDPHLRMFLATRNQTDSRDRQDSR